MLLKIASIAYSLRQTLEQCLSWRYCAKGQAPKEGLVSSKETQAQSTAEDIAKRPRPPTLSCLW
ncbi:MAG: hypothetical protein CMA79_01980 [Euryarchaeota archaeon]|nr:hypothetical protein [Euryarchaeota archaeon]